MMKLTMLVAGGVGYVLGSRAGRERYETIKTQAMKVWNDPKVQKKVDEAEHVARDKANDASSAASDLSDKARSKTGNSDSSTPGSNTAGSSTYGDTLHSAPTTATSPSATTNPRGAGL